VGNKLRQSTIFSNIVNGQNSYRMFTSLKRIRWVKPGCFRGVLSSWNRDGNVTKKGERRKIVSQHAFGGQSGKSDTIGALKMYKIVFRVSK